MKRPLLDQNNMEEHNSNRLIAPFQDKDENYPENEVKTSRYNLVTYLPKCLFEQFRRLANVYFVVLGIIALIGTYTGAYLSAVEPDSLLAPVILVVMISVIKEGIEDFKRHQADAIVNARPVKMVDKYDGAIYITERRNLMVGSIVLLSCDEEIPADIVVLASGGVQGDTAYVETAAIDGETNLKIKLSALVRDIEKLGSGSGSGVDGGERSNENVYEQGILVSEDKKFVRAIPKLNIRINAEAPNSSIHHFDGSAEFTDSSSNLQNATLSEKNLLLRGSILRATEWCVGMVVYTGKQTKLSLNSRSPPSKLSTVDRVVNSALVVAIGSMITVCIISVFLSIAWQDKNINADYLCLQSDDLTPPYSSADGGGCNSSAPSSGLTIFTFATLYNNFVCISMYVSLEMIYLAQAYFIQNDLNMYDAETDTPAECHTSGMCADIGQVQYILSDKTGTLTKNIMTLRRCSIGGVIYGAPIQPPAVDADSEDIVGDEAAALVSIDGSSRVTSNTNNDVDLRKESELSDLADDAEGVISPVHAAGAGVIISNPVHSNGTGCGSGSAGNPPLVGLRLSEFKSSNDENPTLLNKASAASASATASASAYYPLEDIAKHRHNHPSGKEAAVMDYLLNLTVCNTVMLMPDATTGKLDIHDIPSLQKSLNAESPDEVALVLAAAGFGSELLVRRDASETLVCGVDTTKGSGSAAGDASNEHRFTIMATNEFDSTRKRMSVLARESKPNSPPVLYCKGADTSMLPRCFPSKDTDACLKHIEEFALTGLRTLVMAKKVLTEEQAAQWLITYKNASNNIGQRKEMLYACAMEIEKDMELLGAVGIEDELQDGVSTAIQTLQRSGLNVWMITGDKPETAIAISQMCSLLRAEHQIHRLVGIKGDELRRKVFELRQLGDREAARAEAQQRQMEEEQQSDVVKAIKKWYSCVAAYISGDHHASSRHDSSSGASNNAALTHRRSTIGGVEVGQLALVVDGTSLEGIWENESLKNEFTAAVRVFPTVVACRVSPLQKASLVRMVKTGAGQPITLAIGDGANDVGMIQEARVGVGISGREGRHAANSADFAIGQFQFLVPLLLHHGRFNYIRCSNLVLYSFFKNLVLVSMLFYYCFYSGFSGTVYVDSFVLSGYNFYLGLPIIALGALDFDVSKQEVMAHPKLAYNTGRLGELLNNWNMLRWCTSAFLYGMLIYTVCIRYFSGPLSYTDGDQNDSGVLYMLGLGFNNQNGQDGGIYTEGFLMFSVLVWSMQYKIVMMTHCMTYINWAVWWLSFFGYFLFCWVYGLVPDLDDNDWYHVVNFTFPQPQYWLAVFSIPILFVIVDLLFERSLAYLFPTSQDFLQRKVAADHEAAEKKKRGK